MDEWQFIAERKIVEAMEEGAFDNLQGKGEPLDLRENPFEDASQRMAHRLLRNNGFAPAWIIESAEIDAEIWRLRSAAKLGSRDLRERVAALNRRIMAFNLKPPAASLHKMPLKIAGEE